MTTCMIVSGISIACAVVSLLFAVLSTRRMLEADHRATWWQEQARIYEKAVTEAYESRRLLRSDFEELRTMARGILEKKRDWE